MAATMGYRCRSWSHRGINVVAPVSKASADDQTTPVGGSPQAGGPSNHKHADVQRNTPLPVRSLLVKYREGVSPVRADGTAVGQARTDVKLRPGDRTGLGRWRTVGLAVPLPPARAAAVAEELQADPRVVAADPNLRFTHTASDVTPDDPLFAEQWDLLAPVSATDDHGHSSTIRNSDAIGVGRRARWRESPQSWPLSTPVQPLTPTLAQ